VLVNAYVKRNSPNSAVGRSRQTEHKSLSICCANHPMLRRVLATWGNGDCGRLGFARLGHGELLPRVVGALLDVEIKQVACGGAHTAVVAADGTVFTMGLNDRGQLGLDTQEPKIAVCAWLFLLEVGT
jgi:alpha-tubulin suppressor-like RCC1 family protein